MAIDPPYRFDPFQNLVNVQWGGPSIIAFVYCAHNANGGIMTYAEDLKLGYTTGNPAKYPDQAPPPQTEYDHLTDRYMTNTYGRGFCVKSRLDYTNYGLPNLPCNVTDPGTLAIGISFGAGDLYIWHMTLDIEETTGEALRDENGKLIAGTEQHPFVAPCSVNFKVKGFILGDTWQVPLHWEGPNGQEPNGGCHYRWSSASTNYEHRRKQLFDEWTTGDEESGPPADILNSFSIDFSNLSYDKDGKTYDAVGIRAMRNKTFYDDDFTWILDQEMLSDSIFGFDYYHSNDNGLITTVGYKHPAGAAQTVEVIFEERQPTA